MHRRGIGQAYGIVEKAIIFCKSGGHIETTEGKHIVFPLYLGQRLRLQLLLKMRLQRLYRHVCRVKRIRLDGVVYNVSLGSVPEGRTTTVTPPERSNLTTSEAWAGQRFPVRPSA